MVGLKEIRVREATLQDVGLFKKLWWRFMEEQADKGDLILATKVNLKFYSSLFAMYVAPRVPVRGFVLFVADQAVSMWGDPQPHHEFKLGKMARCWGMYVEPESRRLGIANAFHSKAEELLLSQGFDFCVTDYVDGDWQALRSSDGAGRKIVTYSSNAYWILGEGNEEREEEEAPDRSDVPKLQESPPDR